MSSVFQSLIGRLKTLVCVVGSVDGVWFQSLIGRLKTHDAQRGTRRHRTAFQSLIGRLKTCKVALRRHSVPTAFQSLIGRLKTYESFDKMFLELVTVSIPHR